MFAQGELVSIANDEARYDESSSATEDAETGCGEAAADLVL